ncbi:unnamed protein product [Agarophyton chilense]
MLSISVLLATMLAGVFVINADASGGNLDPCRMNSDCAMNRTCRVFKLDIGKAILQIFGKGFDLGNLISSITPTCKSDDNYCLCLPSSDNVFKCMNTSTCLLNEVCTSEQYCVSKEQQEYFGEARKCISNSACRSNQECAKFVLDAAGFCLAKMDKALIGNSTSNPDSNSTNPNNDNSPFEEVCVAAKFLTHIPANGLLYKNHVSARVLCDSFESCATPGHIVRYRGKAMMMKSYCTLVGNCSTKIMAVNSPRYRLALDVPSSTANMSFTAFAARHGTKAEEYILGAVVRIGF